MPDHRGSAFRQLADGTDVHAVHRADRPLAGAGASSHLDLRRGPHGLRPIPAHRGRGSGHPGQRAVPLAHPHGSRSGSVVDRLWRHRWPAGLRFGGQLHRPGGAGGGLDAAGNVDTRWRKQSAARIQVLKHSWDLRGAFGVQTPGEKALLRPDSTAAIAQCLWQPLKLSGLKPLGKSSGTSLQKNCGRARGSSSASLTKLYRSSNSSWLKRMGAAKIGSSACTTGALGPWRSLRSPATPALLAL